MEIDAQNAQLLPNAECTYAAGRRAVNVTLNQENATRENQSSPLLNGAC
jgi:hypothetical protein